MISKDREYRMFGIQTRTEDKENEMIVEGYALTFNEPTVLFTDENGTEWSEQIDRHALDNAKMDDVVLNFNHSGKPFARTRNKTLELTVDDKGLFVRADLSGTQGGRDLYEEIKGGYIDKMSFAFIYDASEFDKKTRLNTITGINRLFDVSAVDFPAYDTTSINARSAELFKAEAERERAEVRQAEIDAVIAKITLAKIDESRKANEDDD